MYGLMLVVRLRTILYLALSCNPRRIQQCSVLRIFTNARYQIAMQNLVGNVVILISRAIHIS
jgi:hypothetical protein